MGRRWAGQVDRAMLLSHCLARGQPLHAVGRAPAPASCPARLPQHFVQPASGAGTGHFPLLPCLAQQDPPLGLETVKQNPRGEKVH